jgi:hypothetical protein
MLVRRVSGLLGLAVLLAVLAPSGTSADSNTARPFLFGVDDDAMKWVTDPAPLAASGGNLGVQAWRITIPWQPGKTALSADDRTAFDRIEFVRPRPRVVLAVLGRSGRDAPTTATRRAQYCAFARAALKRWSGIKDIVIGNEVNKNLFWNHPAPVAYERLLATCYDLLHRARRDVNVISSLGPRATAPADISPYYYILALGRAYRESHRTRPLFDTFGQNVYGASSRESPAAHHGGGLIALGDYQKLEAALSIAFGATPQPLPSPAHPRIWYLELGYQTSIPTVKAADYNGQENAITVPAVGRGSQLEQLKLAVKTAYCQPAVGALFNFEMTDESRLSGWQSGLFYVDATPKPSYAPLRRYLAQVRAGQVRC